MLLSTEVFPLPVHHRSKPFDIGLHVGWWHQAHGMAKRLELARPMVRRGASLDANQAWWQLLEERQNGATL